jgi:hypothetical protein
MIYITFILPHLPLPTYPHIHHVSQERYVFSQLQSIDLKQLTQTDSHPSSAAFDVINQTLQANEADRKDAIDKAKAIVAFNLKNSGGEEAAWYLDLKNKGEVGQGLAPQGAKADGKFTFRSDHARRCFLCTYTNLISL